MSYILFLLFLFQIFYKLLFNFPIIYIHYHRFYYSIIKHSHSELISIIAEYSYILYSPWYPIQRNELWQREAQGRRKLKIRSEGNGGAMHE